MRAVHEQRRLELATEVLQRGDVRRIAVHREQALRHHKDRVLSVASTDPVEMPPDRGDVEVAMEIHVPRGGSGALLQAGMREPVDHHMILGAHQRLDHAEARRPACGIEHGVLHAEEVGDRAFQRERVPGIAKERRRAGAVYAILVDCCLGGLLDRGV
jgi:hypothetical protein